MTDLAWARSILFASMFALSAALTGCSSDGEKTEATPGTAEEIPGDRQGGSRDVVEGLRTDAERVADEVRRRSTPEAKQQLLDRCREAVEQLRRASSESADRVAGVCDRVQSSDLDDAAVWNEIKQEIEKIP